jgi:hypothetical protein
MSVAQTTEDLDVQQLGERLERARKLFERQSARITDLEFEAEEAGIAKDKALYWLLRLIETSHAENWQVSEEAEVIVMHATFLLGDHNIFPGLKEPNDTMLRLMELIARDEEGHEYAEP